VSETALTPATVGPIAKKDALDSLKARYDKLQQRDLNIVHNMDRFAELPSFVEETARAELIALLANGTDQEVRDKYGFKNKRDLRIALYGTLPKKDWPAAMQAAHERAMARIRKQATEKKTNTFNLNIISMPAREAPRPDEKIIEVHPEPVK
jgi:hypothetical protein